MFYWEYEPIHVLFSRCPITLVCFEYTHFTFNFILLNVHTENRQGLLHLNLDAANHVCLGFLNLFFV